MLNDSSSGISSILSRDHYRFTQAFPAIKHWAHQHKFPFAHSNPFLSFPTSLTQQITLDGHPVCSLLCASWDLALLEPSPAGPFCLDRSWFHALGFLRQAAKPQHSAPLPVISSIWKFECGWKCSQSQKMKCAFIWISQLCSDPALPPMVEASLPFLHWATHCQHPSKELLNGFLKENRCAL